MSVNLSDISSTIKGNQETISSFINNLNLNYDGNIWMINGPQGIGKSLFARLLSSKLLSIKYNVNEYENIFHPDLVILRKDKNKKFISVEEVRDLKKLFLKTSFSGTYRIAIIDSINDLNLFGHNALLKTIEEPPKGSFIFIINHQYSYVPTTIKSRCKLLNLRKLNDDEVYHVLENLNLNLNKDDLFFYSKISDGSVGDAIYFINNNSLPFYRCFCKYLINIENFNDIETSKIINLAMDKKNNLILAFFKFIKYLFNKVIKNMFLNKYSIILEEEKLLIEKFSNLYNKNSIFYVTDIIELKYANYTNLNTDIYTTLYSLLLELYKNIKK